MTQGTAISSPRAAQAADRTVYFAPSAPLSLPPGPGSSSKDRAGAYPAGVGTRPSLSTLCEQGTALHPALLLSPTQTLFLAHGDSLGPSEARGAPRAAKLLPAAQTPAGSRASTRLPAGEARGHLGTRG